MILHLIPISMNVRLYFGAKMVIFCIIHIGTNPFACKCLLIIYIIYVKS